jgi:uncharacterized SAM-binding protein YcdF (DUF218 family)
MKAARWRRLWIRILAACCAFVAALAVVACVFAQEILTVDTGPQRAEVMIVLGGGLRDRPQWAAQLFKMGAAALIICSGNGDALNYKPYLIQAGVPAQDILNEPNSSSTRENAEFTIRMLRQRKIRSAIIVTSWFHSRRALRCFEHYAPDIKFYSRPSYYAFNRPEWKRRGINGYVILEYVKILGYWACYGACPL